MKEHYYLDLEQYSLRKLKISLQNRKMIPSRVMLKEQIEERFEILQNNGIHNVKTLIAVLKTPQKIESFSTQSGLPIDYLTVLKREAKSYHPNPIGLKKFPGVDSKDLDALEARGIKHTKQLFEKGHVSEARQQLSQVTGISVERLNELVSLSDLARLYGVGPIFARMIYDAGIRSVKSFVQYDAEEFVRLYEKATHKKADFSVSDMNFCLELAKEFERPDDKGDIE